jgi:hypothetical protein
VSHLYNKPFTLHVRAPHNAPGAVRSAGISEVVAQERIVELPLQGRQVTDPIVLAGAAVETGRPNNRSFQGGVNISVAGGLQFGVAYGGPIVRDRLFFFGAYQGTATRVMPADNIAFVPTAAMLAGDFTAFASPACNGGRQVNLGAGFVNNRIDPARFSPAALNLAKKLPTTTDPCGEARFSLPDDRDRDRRSAASTTSGAPISPCSDAT